MKPKNVFAPQKPFQNFKKSTLMFTIPQSKFFNSNGPPNLTSEELTNDITEDFSDNPYYETIFYSGINFNKSEYYNQNFIQTHKEYFPYPYDGSNIPF